MSEPEAFAGRLRDIRRRIDAACARAGRRPDEVTLLAVSKTVPPAHVRMAMAAGLSDLGENRVQEAVDKIGQLQLPAGSVRWHLIGHLQSNKARRAVELFDTIHSLDNPELARRLDRIAGELGKRLPVFIQTHLGGEETKSGCDENDVPPFCELLGQLPNLELRGLMAIPPYMENPENARPYFRRLRELRDAIQAAGVTGETFRGLSMGMSHDFETAIEEGATHVRIGTALFGERASTINL
ncbi:MAG: YggS family pyridoxal phosphate-dependent enzyme [Blastocatellia bacterium]